MDREKLNELIYASYFAVRYSLMVAMSTQKQIQLELITPLYSLLALWLYSLTLQPSLPKRATIASQKISSLNEVEKSLS